MRFGLLWGLAKVAQTNLSGYIANARGLLCIKGGISDDLGAHAAMVIKDQSVNFKNDSGVIQPEAPARKLFLLLDSPNLATAGTGGTAIAVKIIYDVVTLSSQEQADLYIAGCCG